MHSRGRFEFADGAGQGAVAMAGEVVVAACKRCCRKISVAGAGDSAGFGCAVRAVGRGLYGVENDAIRLDGAAAAREIGRESRRIGFFVGAHQDANQLPGCGVDDRCLVGGSFVGRSFIE